MEDNRKEEMNAESTEEAWFSLKRKLDLPNIGRQYMLQNELRIKTDEVRRKSKIIKFIALFLAISIPCNAVCAVTILDKNETIANLNSDISSLESEVSTLENRNKRLKRENSEMKDDYMFFYNNACIVTRSGDRKSVV